MLLNKAFNTGIISSLSERLFTPLITCTASMKFYKLPPEFPDIELPKTRKLPVLEKVPFIQGVKVPAITKRLDFIRGPETVHNKLLYKQYGIMALSGTFLKPSHLENIRLTVNKYIDEKRMFAAWRIDPPWKPMTKKSLGVKMGGGKGSIYCYATPVKAGRIIIEVGGQCEFEEVLHFLKRVTYCLPCDAMPISEELMEKLKKEEEELERRNINPFTYEHCVKKNMDGCNIWASVYDRYWHGKYI